MERLARYNHPYPYQHFSCAGAGHSTGLPYVSTTVTTSRNSVDGRLYAAGGNATDTAHARAGFWPRMRAFLDEILNGKVE